MFNIKNKLKALFKVIAAAMLMLGTQTISVAGFMGPMVMPLLFWMLAIPNRVFVPLELFSIFLSCSLLGLIVFYSGIVIFCISLAQWFWYRHIKERFFTKGLYSKVRHPQFFGIILVSLGITIKLLTPNLDWSLIGVPFLKTHLTVGKNELIGLWLLQVLGYIAFALLEERSLSKSFPEFKDYKQKVPLLLPIKKPKIIPETAFTIMLVLVICVVLFLLPYNSIRIFQFNLF